PGNVGGPFRPRERGWPLSPPFAPFAPSVFCSPIDDRAVARSRGYTEVPWFLDNAFRLNDNHRERLLKAAQSLCDPDLEVEVRNEGGPHGPAAAHLLRPSREGGRGRTGAPTGILVGRPPRR